MLADVIYLNIFVEPELATHRAAVLKALKIFDHMRNINEKNDERSDNSILETQYELRDVIDILQNSTNLELDGKKIHLFQFIAALDFNFYREILLNTKV